jgi:hypothetical protein
MTNGPERLGLGSEAGPRRKLQGDAKWRAKQDTMCPPGINVCIQRKQARRGVAAEQALRQEDVQADAVAAKREVQQQQRLVAEASAAARQDGMGPNHQALTASAQASTFSNFMLSQHSREAQRGIVQRRAEAKRQHRAKALEYLRARLVEESQWEQAKVPCLCPACAR